VKAAGIEPLAHFLLQGEQEGRYAVDDGISGSEQKSAFGPKRLFSRLRRGAAVGM
jgi:hypothetical protein